MRKIFVIFILPFLFFPFITFAHCPLCVGGVLVLTFLGYEMRLIEVGTKLQNQNKKDEAKEVFDLAYELFNIFWGIKLNIIPADEHGLQRGSMRMMGYADKRGLSNTQIHADNLYNTQINADKDTQIHADNNISDNPRKEHPRESAYDNNISANPREHQQKSAWLKNLIEKIIDCCKE